MCPTLLLIMARVGDACPSCFCTFLTYKESILKLSSGSMIPLKYHMYYEVSMISQNI